MKLASSFLLCVAVSVLAVEFLIPSTTALAALKPVREPSYMREVRVQQTPTQIGRDPLHSVDQITPSPATSSEPQEPISVELERPKLEALITIEHSYNPFALDAEKSEKISLEEALRAALVGNLDISRQCAQTANRKFLYLSSLSKFLPDLNGGYSLYGVNGSLPGGLLSSSSVKLPGTIQLLSAGFTYHAYQGGKVLYGALEQKNRLRAAGFSLRGTTNDVLLQVSRMYNDLVLNEALLEVRARAVETSEEQVRLNSQQELAGLATRLDVRQAQAQLASDQQSLIDQQQQRRLSSISLTAALNQSFALDLVSSEQKLELQRLIPRDARLNELISLAIENRPELKQYEELRLAAKRSIAQQAAALQPQVDFGGTTYGFGSRSLSSLKLLSLGVSWTLGGLGTTDTANIQAARWQARDAVLQAKEKFQSVFQQVRTAYDQSLCAEARVNRADSQITAAEEELRIAVKRKQAGVGLSIDVLNAQRDLTQARINKARALVDFNSAQDQLLHDIGLISVETLTHGRTI